MGTKVNTQVLADLLAEKAGISKRSADTFVKAFIQTTIEGGLSDGNVKIKGLGSFKIVKVADRESTNVNTGERILIAGYNKMSFVPDIDLDMLPATNTEAVKVDDSKKTVRKPARKKTAEPIIEEKTVEETPAADEKPIVVSEPVIEEKTVEETPAADEKPIVVPEPVIEEKTVAEIPAADEKPTVVQEPVVEEKTVSETPAADEKPTVVQEPVVEEKTVAETPATDEKTIVAETPTVAVSSSRLKAAFESNKPLWYSIAIALVLIIVVFVILLSGDDGKVKNEDLPQSEQVEAGVSDYQDTQSTEPSATQPTESVEASQPQATGTHRVHVLQKGETLTTISLYYYHTPDSMRAIWKLNNFPDPNDIPIGTEILLP